jgi:autotransporter-associated beta strand protein
MGIIHGLWLGTTNGDFNTISNWNVPSVPDAEAVFGSTGATSISFSADTTIDFWTFNPVGNPNPSQSYTFTLASGRLLQFQTFGITGNGANATINNAGDLKFNNSSSAGSATINNTGNLSFNQNSTAGSATITNTGTLTFDGTLNQLNNSNAGSATITTNSGGTTFFLASTDASNAALIANGSGVGGGVVDFSGHSSSINVGLISGDGSFKLGSIALSVGGTNNNNIMSGVISSDVAVSGVSLIKVGTGLLVLSGTNTYSGATAVSVGKLQIDGSISTSSGVTVQDGGTLSGHGTTSGVTVESGGTLSPGDVTGILHTGNVAVASGGIFAVELGGAATPGADYDQLVIAGTVNLNGSTLSISILNAFNPAAGDSFLVIDNDGADAVIGAFAAASRMVTVGSRALRIDYHAGDGNDVSLMAGGVVINGTAGADLVDAGNTAGAEPLPTLDADLIFGFDGSDHLDGLAGDDVLVGGLGKDFLTGGLGADTFDFDLAKESKKGATHDVINGFDRGADDIDLSDIDAKKGAGNQAFKFIGKQDFHHHKGELHYFKQGSHITVEGDTNGDGHADFQIQVNGVGKLGAGDFIL